MQHGVSLLKRSLFSVVVAAFVLTVGSSVALASPHSGGDIPNYIQCSITVAIADGTKTQFGIGTDTGAQLTATLYQDVDSHNHGIVCYYHAVASVTSASKENGQTLTAALYDSQYASLGSCGTDEVPNATATISGGSATATTDTFLPYPQDRAVASVGSTSVQSPCNN